MAKNLTLTQMVDSIVEQIESGDAGNQITISGNTTKKALKAALIDEKLPINSVVQQGNRFQINFCGVSALASLKEAEKTRAAAA